VKGQGVRGENEQEKERKEGRRPTIRTSRVSEKLVVVRKVLKAIRRSFY
jgi:hypothetical protein